MPRYFFHIRDRDNFLEDLEGSDFTSIEAALADAVQAIREILAELIFAGQVRDGQQFEISDERGDVIHTVPFQRALLSS